MIKAETSTPLSGSLSLVSQAMSCKNIENFSQACASLLASDLLANIATRNYIRNLVKHKDCFTGRQAVDWMIRHERAKNRPDAILKGELLFRMGFVKAVSPVSGFRDTRALYRCQNLLTVEKPRNRSGLALVAHNNMKSVLLKWAQDNKDKLSRHTLYATGTTGSLISNATGLEIGLLKSGPLGGDQQIGAMIAEGMLNTLIFFWDPLTAQPHDNDVKALLRIAVMYNTAVAMNEATADYLLRR